MLETLETFMLHGHYTGHMKTIEKAVQKLILKFCYRRNILILAYCMNK